MRTRIEGDPDVSDGLKRVFGIDLGTTYSAIAYVDEHGKPVIVPNQESERITPSVVLFDGDNIIVGNTAKESAKVEPDKVVQHIKRTWATRTSSSSTTGRSTAPKTSPRSSSAKSWATPILRSGARRSPTS